MSDFNIDKLAAEVALKNGAEDWEEFRGMLRDVRKGGAAGGFSGFTATLDTVDFTEENWDRLTVGMRKELELVGAKSLAEYVGSFASVQDSGLSILDVEAAMMSRFHRAVGVSRQEDHWQIVANGIAWWALERVARAAEDQEIDQLKVCEEMQWLEPGQEQAEKRGQSR